MGVEHVFHRYEGANHAFQRFDSEERYHPEASEDAWEKVLAFFEEKLKEAAPRDTTLSPITR